MDPASFPVARPTSWMERRASGVLLHPTSLPGASGIGDLGPSAYRFAAFLRDAGASWWQMLPVGPIGAGNSPYQSASSFAGNPLLVNLDGLAADGLLSGETVLPQATLARVDYPAVIRFKESRLRRAFSLLDGSPFRPQFEDYLAHQPGWLSDYTLFLSLQRAHGGKPWWLWPAAHRDRNERALAEARAGKLAGEIRYHAFVQFAFDRQWRTLADHCHESGIGLIGDLPIYVALDSAEVWANRALFDLLPDGTPRAVSGVPPDYFSADGQLWGNPLYRWEEHARQGYAWWIDRLRTTLSRFDVVRLDHFIAFVNYWAVPSDSLTAKNGRWETGPGLAFFERVRQALGSLPFLAEDLGEVTPPVHELREKLGLPGMRVLQFSFTHDGDGPENFPEDTAAYTGTHDNNTLLGWLRDPPERHEPAALAAWMLERERVLSAIGGDGPETHWKLIRMAFASPSRLAVAPLQDLLGLGSEARMNQPGTTRGNWEWRYLEDDLTSEVASRFRAIVTETGHAASAASKPALR